LGLHSLPRVRGVGLWSQLEVRDDIKMPQDKEIYYLDCQTGDGQLISSFTNPTASSFNLDGHMANYFDLDFFRIKNFGPDSYIFER